jgi:hypothetical protein
VPDRAILWCFLDLNGGYLLSFEIGVVDSRVSVGRYFPNYRVDFIDI